MPDFIHFVYLAESDDLDLASADDLRRMRQSRQEALYQARVRAEQIHQVSADVRRIDAMLAARGERSF